MALPAVAALAALRAPIRRGFLLRIEHLRAPSLLPQMGYTPNEAVTGKRAGPEQRGSSGPQRDEHA